FVKSGDDYIRVATNVSMRTGGRGLGTVLTGAPLESIKAGKAYYGKASILGTPMSAAMSRSRTHRVRLSAFISSATRSDLPAHSVPSHLWWQGLLEYLDRIPPSSVRSKSRWSCPGYRSRDRRVYRRARRSAPAAPRFE